MMEVALGSFADRFRGRIVRPSDQGYGEAAHLDVSLGAPQPAVVVWPRDAADVAEALRFAREAGLAVSVRSGGHAASGHSLVQGGLTIHLGDMKAITADQERGTVRAQAGCLAGEINAYTREHMGMKAAPLGVAHTVGSGYSLYGGFSMQSRKNGLCIDNIVSIELVTADGRILTLSETENRDLFWAARGAGPALGVVTCIEQRVHDVSTFYGGTVILPEERFKDLNRFIFRNRHDRDLANLTYLIRTPDGPITFAFIGHFGEMTREEKEAYFAPVLEMGPFENNLGKMDYFQTLGVFGPLWHSLPSPRRGYWRSGALVGLQDAADFDSFLDAYFEVWKHLPEEASLSAMNIELYGGAIDDVAPDATAYGTRGTEFLFGMLPTWLDPADDERIIRYTDAGKARLCQHPKAKEAGYINFSMHDDPALYYGANLERLARIKAEIDPHTMFRRCMDLTRWPAPRKAPALSD